ncbi:MAG: NIPSNAP family protein [Anaerolineae bacterium]
MFFELRQYRVKPGKREEWVELMEKEIIPFQIAQGMVVIGSFVGEQEEDLYVWIRRFENEAQREALYQRVYESDYWKNEISPRVGDILDRERIVVTRLTPTSKSVIR